MKWTAKNNMNPSPAAASDDRPGYCGSPAQCRFDWVGLFAGATLAEELLVTMSRTFFVVRRIGCEVCCLRGCVYGCVCVCVRVCVCARARARAWRHA